MKAFLHLTFLIILLNLFSCKEATSETKIEVPNKQIEIKIKDTISKDSIVKIKKPAIRKRREHYYVSAKTGLNYRETPKGKVLGKFPLNTYLEIIEHTKVFEQIKDNGKTLKGEWLGVDNEKDTVYVFNIFLSEFYTYSEINLFYASPYYKSYDEIRQGFVNLSEIYPFDYEKEFPTIITRQELELGKEIVSFNQSQKSKILNKLKISNKDTLYIYNFHKDSIYKFCLDNLTTIAYLNTYRKGEKNVKEYDYEIGLNLADKFKSKNIGYAHIGKTNPFKSGKIKTIIWIETDNHNFPLQNKKLNYNFTLDTYTYSLFDFDYFIQTRHFEIGKSNQVDIYHLVIVNKISNSIVFQKEYQQSESTFLYPIQTSNKKGEYNSKVWTGEVFKNKPSIIFGLVGIAYSCPTIDFISETEPPIRISCDSRD